MDGVEHAIAVFTALPQLFPSQSKARSQIEAIFHVLTPSENPDTFLRTQSISSCPVRRRKLPSRRWSNNIVHISAREIS
ncbi:hypothetical protein AALO_G00202200 [Alosa alosa]|uniref:Uncharacterized protein n=1 Tax=Alosa alosa TaxID=278164 RepID=A0AAV6G7R6_9TELE|nr:hypothetical protein AALO_G00202200 [Alosa alosa]